MNLLSQNHSLRETGIPSQQSGWVGELSFELKNTTGRTEIGGLRHRGPLRVQRPFYPEQNGTSHIYLLHPPGGVVGGDQLRLEIHATENSLALLTAPSATKLYRSLGNWANIKNYLHVESGATLEWFPHETIAFNGTKTELCTVAELEGDGQFVGWEILCLGRPAAKEKFTYGSVVQRLEIYRDGHPLFIDRLAIHTGSSLLTASWGLAEQPIVGMLALSGKHDGLLSKAQSFVNEFMSQEDRRSLFACTELEGVLVLRYLGPSAADCSRLFCAFWKEFRPHLSNRTAVSPRTSKPRGPTESMS